LSSDIIHPLSDKNIRVKSLISSADEFFFFEGEKLTLDILNKGFTPDILLLTDPRILKRKTGISSPSTEILHLTEKAMKRISTMKSPPPVIAVFREIPCPTGFFDTKVIFILDDIQDPGNMGSIFRCAAAFGIRSIAMTGNCARLNNRKFLRTARDSVFHISILRMNIFEEILDDPGMQNYNIYLTSSHLQTQTGDANMITLPAAIVLGNEGKGIDKKYFERFRTLSLPQSDLIESLNAGITGCILMNLISEKFQLVD
jgi:TrmH family RNA methyltransferase